ncbi:GATA transcription factor 9-like [Prosopis cineraria]|uniref:GATA transcription factor 9-like n=1 Tax=Prosopis cineraria TaxID=364024 RepID=UPI00240F50B7|nr:GATA transcription factor 9-like [Prosopis cineraria]
MEAPDFFQTPNNMPAADSFVVEDLLDFPNDDEPLLLDDVSALHSLPGKSANSSTVATVDASPVSHPNVVGDIGCRSFHDLHLPGDLCVPVPYDDMAELEWLSNVVEESFSSEDLQKLHLISGIKARNDVEASETHELQAENNRSVNSPIFNSEVSVPAKARSKRSRGSPCNWNSRLLLLSPSPSASPSPSSTSSSSDPDVVLSTGKKPGKSAPRRKDSGGEGRKCLHCATDKTPQWRTGPMGPKTLCNACGVRYKSGRLVPEYRPAASPTFVLTKHSNSHRKVMELRRQKEMQQQQHHQVLQHPNMMFEFHVSNGDDYLIHQHLGPDFRQLI